MDQLYTWSDELTISAIVFGMLESQSGGVLQGAVRRNSTNINLYLLRADCVMHLYP